MPAEKEHAVPGSCSRVREVIHADAAALSELRRRWAWMYTIPAPVGPRRRLMAWRPDGDGCHIVARTVAALAAAIEADAGLLPLSCAA